MDETFILLGRHEEGHMHLLGDLYVLKKTLNYPQLNCQPGVSKLRVVEKYMPKVKGW
jgi:hypothetical protein